MASLFGNTVGRGTPNKAYPANTVPYQGGNILGIPGLQGIGRQQPNSLARWAWELFGGPPAGTNLQAPPTFVGQPQSSLTPVGQRTWNDYSALRQAGTPSPPQQYFRELDNMGGYRNFGAFPLDLTWKEQPGLPGGWQFQGADGGWMNPYFEMLQSQKDARPVPVPNRRARSLPKEHVAKALVRRGLRKLRQR